MLITRPFVCPPAYLETIKWIAVIFSYRVGGVNSDPQYDKRSKLQKVLGGFLRIIFSMIQKLFIALGALFFTQLDTLQPTGKHI